MINRAGNHFDLNRHEIPWIFGAAVAVAVRSVGGPPILEAGGVILDKIEGVLLELMDMPVIKISSLMIDKAIKSCQVGHPRDIANAVMFLVTTPFATSSTVRVDGGGTIVRGHHA
jgi:hypothetical protein